MGLVAVDKNTVAVSVSDVMISFAAFPIEIPGEVSGHFIPNKSRQETKKKNANIIFNVVPRWFFFILFITMPWLPMILLLWALRVPHLCMQLNYCQVPS